jgi:hypothetical protein
MSKNCQIQYKWLLKFHKHKHSLKIYAVGQQIYNGGEFAGRREARSAAFVFLTLRGRHVKCVSMEYFYLFTTLTQLPTIARQAEQTYQILLIKIYTICHSSYGSKSLAKFDGFVQPDGLLTTHNNLQ